MHFSAGCLAVFLPLLFLMACGKPALQVPQVHIIWSDCEGISVASVDSHCGRFYPSPAQPATYIGFAVLRPSKASASAVPVLYLSGGPGEGGNSLATTLNRWRFRLVDNDWQRPVVLLDSRGNEGAWGSFDCEAYRQLGINQLAGRLGDADDEERIAKNCLNHWQVQLANTGFEQFSAEQNARDAMALMAALKFEQWHLVSVSYGSRVAEWIQALAPTQVQSLLLDSPYSWQQNTYAAKIAQWQTALERFFEDCAQAKVDCGGADIGQLFWLSIAQLDVKPLQLKYSLQGFTETALIDGAQFAHLFFALLYDANNYSRLIPALQAISLGEIAPFQALVAPIISASLRPGASPWLYWLTECNDNQQFSLAQAEAQWQQLASLWQPLLRRDMGVSICHWVPTYIPLRAPERITGHPGAPVATVILAGAQDPVASPSKSQDMARERQGVLLLAPQQGHGVLFDEVCGADWLEAYWQAPASFVANPLSNGHNFGRCILSNYLSSLEPVH
ncbi:MAG: alpha/beta hydrolase [Marinagarivorans sp.]|nr:alpha/beta hydrolase [Marinagarivorans sp.]